MILAKKSTYKFWFLVASLCLRWRRRRESSLKGRVRGGMWKRAGGQGERGESGPSQCQSTDFHEEVIDVLHGALGELDISLITLIHILYCSTY